MFTHNSKISNYFINTHYNNWVIKLTVNSQRIVGSKYNANNKVNNVPTGKSPGLYINSECIEINGLV